MNRRMTCSTLTFTLCLIQACAGGADGGGGRDGDGGGGDSGPKACEAGGFGDELDYGIPSGGFPMASDADHCNYRGNRTGRTYRLTDLDGDAMPDLVVTADCAQDGTIGTTHWEVYRNEDGAFATTAERMAIPAGGFPMASDFDHCNYTGNRTGRTYSLTDLDGDDRPDLVVTADCQGDATVGSSHWQVYLNDGGRFSDTAERFALPAGGFPMASDADHCNYRGNRTGRTYTLTDMDGDGRPDLVVTAECAGDPAIGTAHWNVYTNEGSGFSTTAARFELPSGGFPMATDYDHCNYTGNRSGRTYQLRDVTRDGLPDLILTAECSGDADLGVTHWAVYKNEGGRFATDALTYALPAGGFPMASDFDHCSYTGNRTGRTYTLTDINGDALPDLVLTGDCAGDATVGSERWAVYPMVCNE